MENIIQPTSEFDFTNLKLSLPTPLQNYFFSKISFNNSPLYIKCPKCSTKQFITKTHKKMNSDLIFEIVETDLMAWIENLEQTCIQHIYKQSNIWFEESLEKHDIENAFIPSLKLYKSGKFFLLHVNIKPNIKVFNEDQMIINLEEIKDNPLLTIIEIQGIKFNNKNFQIEMELKQCMVVKPDPFLDNCFIKTSNSSNQIKLNFEKDEYLGKEDEEEEIVYTLPVVNTIQENINTPLEISLEEPLENKEEPLENTPDIKNEILEEYITEIIPDNIELQEIELENITELEDNYLGEPELSESIQLKKPDEVYFSMYKKALEKAKELKKQALESYLAAQNIKQLYMLENLNEEEDNFDNL
jgi:hypothetical protein